MPVSPRAGSGGHSDSTYLVTGQFSPQMTEVNARNRRPEGAMRALALRWLGAVIFSDDPVKPGKESGPPCRLSGLEAIARRASCPAAARRTPESFLCKPQGTINSCPVNSGCCSKSWVFATIFSLGNL